jgi:hypothetical protein
MQIAALPDGGKTGVDPALVPQIPAYNHFKAVLTLKPRDELCCTCDARHKHGQHRCSQVGHRVCGRVRMTTLTYFFGRGLAEIPRWMLAATGESFVNKGLSTPEELDALRASGVLAMNQVGERLCVGGPLECCHVSCIVSSPCWKLTASRSCKAVQWSGIWHVSTAWIVAQSSRNWTLTW